MRRLDIRDFTLCDFLVVGVWFWLVGLGFLRLGRVCAFGVVLRVVPPMWVV